MTMLESYRGRDFIGVEELSTTAAALVDNYQRAPIRGSVRLAITPRIVRHYLGEDLLGETTGLAGTSIVFNYGNLLRLLAVKKLLADNWSLVKIRGFMSTLDITALEELVNSALSPTVEAESDDVTESEVSNNRATSNLRSAQRRLPDATPSVSPLFAAKASMPSPPTPLASLAIESARRERSAAEWVEIATGLEVKVRRSFRPPQTEEEREKIQARFWAVISKKEDGD
jgi:hypothetical protein